MALDRHGRPIPVFVPPHTTKPPEIPPVQVGEIPTPHVENDVASLMVEMESLKARVATLETWTRGDVPEADSA